MAAANRAAKPQYLVGNRDRLAIFFGQSRRAGIASSAAVDDGTLLKQLGHTSVKMNV
ncbi:hypothetical protein [Oceaniovalibus sp. ACAM 378]|uniref:hypothetical protein n=1 Tax=Oceaniovalibus sp. ACAM 378 TaxID=2599923 RepID=UPI001651C18B|nr:hypothetical protein [Oceaniovalibus sp. ACAM 378]